MNKDIQKLESKIFELTQELNTLRKLNEGETVENYAFSALDGDVTLLELFGDKDHLLMIHNMGQGCRYCTLWADGFNGFLPHLESALSVVLVSKDAPELQRTFASSRQWRFRMASHGGGAYAAEQSVMDGEANMPGAVLYERRANTISRKNAVIFGPGDQFCSLWNLLGLAGMGESDWTPQFRYWSTPEKMDDGGANLVD